MATTIIWQQGSDNPDNRGNFEKICQWWDSLTGKEITFAQRLIPQNNNIEEIDWQEQRFDETFLLKSSEIRGITLYWQKIGEENERNLTANKLELDPNRQELYIYSQSQKQVIIRVRIPQVKYQLIDLNNPQIAANMIGKDCLLLLQDDRHQIEVKLKLSPDKQLYLLSLLAKLLKLDANFKVM
jgi:hypothetical protein